jgi:hypothetical protein
MIHMVIEDDINKRNLANGIEAMINKITEPDYVDYTNQLQGTESVKQFYSILIVGFSDYHRIIMDIIDGGDKIWVRTTNTMTYPPENFAGYLVRAKR